MKNSTLKFLLFASLMLNTAFLGAAGYQYYKESSYWTSPVGYKVQHGHFLFEELALKPEQMNDMRDRAMKFRKIIDGKKEEIGAERKKLIALLREDNPDKGALKASVSRLSGMQEQMQTMIVMHMLDMKRGLDKEQQTKFLDLIENSMTEGGQMSCPPSAAH